MKTSLIVLPVLSLTLVGLGYAGGSFIQEDGATDHAAQVAADHGDIEPAADVPADPHVSDAVPPADPYALAEDRRLVRVGQITVPVQKPRSTSYVVADIALRARDIGDADRITRVSTAVRARDVLLLGLHELAEGPLMRGVTIDADALAQALTDRLRKTYPEVEDVIFVSLFKQDVPRG